MTLFGFYIKRLLYNKNRFLLKCITVFDIRQCECNNFLEIPLERAFLCYKVRMYEYLFKIQYMYDKYHSNIITSSSIQI